jgi:hypothetical protein
MVYHSITPGIIMLKRPHTVSTFLPPHLVVLGLVLFAVQFGWSQACGEGSFQAEAVLNGNTWTARNGNTNLYSGNDMRTAMQEAVNSLSAGRNTKERVVVQGSGTMAGNASLVVPSYTVLDVCGTIHVNSAGSGDNAPVRMRGARDVEVRYLTITGTPSYSMFIREGSNIHLGQIDIRVSSGFGIRIDNNPSGGGNWGMTNRVTNVRIDSVYVSGTSNHGVETYGVDGLTIGTVVARNTGYAGLLLNATINATIGTVDAEGAGTGTGYAAFRMANRNGQINGQYPLNIRVGRVRAIGGGRGIFCVSESGGVEIENIELSNNGGNSVLIENCYNVNVASVSGTVSGGGEFRLAARSEFANSRDITVQNIAFTNTAIRESPCGENVVFRNITRSGNSSLDICTSVITEPISSSSSSVSSSSAIPSDCNGDEGGSAVLDDCGRCVGGNTGRTACDFAVQGENFCAADGVQESTNGGFLGAGYLNFDNELQSSGTFVVESGGNRDYTLALRFANGAAADRPMQVSMNGVVQVASVSFPSTGDWTTWNTTEVVVPLVQGRNELVFTSLATEGGPNLDVLGFVESGVSAHTCELPVINAYALTATSLQVHWEGDRLYVAGAPAGARIEVYNLQGQLQAVGKVQGEGGPKSENAISLSLSVAGSPGVHVIRMVSDQSVRHFKLVR